MDHLDPKAPQVPKKKLQETQDGHFRANKMYPPPRGDRTSRKLILCFDGTGNKFHGDDSDSNILKIFRMLDRTADDQYHYYQRMSSLTHSTLVDSRNIAGIGTYVVSGSLTHTGVRARLSSWYQKAKDSAVGSSFDQHVVGGYRFLMRFYNPGDDIYMFGFSRGAYIARFLAEMLDYIGLLSHGNEEMVKFAWKAFAQWQCRQTPTGSDEEIKEADKKKHEMYHFMKGFRETFSRPVGRIRFLGLFDTVNSVPRFETAWMQRSKFPYTARSSAKVIRHAVSIDERRAKFRQDLVYQASPTVKHHRHHHLGQFFDMAQAAVSDTLAHDPTANENSVNGTDAPKPSNGTNGTARDDVQRSTLAPEPRQSSDRGRRGSQFLDPGRNQSRSNDRRGSNEQFPPYRARSKSRQRSRQRSNQRCAEDTVSTASGISPSEVDPDWDEDGQDIDEVWFAGGHGDVGGGWEAVVDSKASSHVPLAWIVREAIKAGLPFDLDKVAEMGCWAEDSIAKAAEDTQAQSGRDMQIPDIRVGSPPQSPLGPPSPEMGRNGGQSGSTATSSFHEQMEKASTGLIHDSLQYGNGLGVMAVSAWNFMEHLPFRRMDLQADGTWTPIRWPLPRGEVRDIPDNVRVHGSVIRRMKHDEKYRPGNLIVGGGGRGVRFAPEKYGIGHWECVAEEGDPVGEIWVRKPGQTVV